MFIKRFLEWIGVKQKLEANDYKPPLVNEGDLWWCAISENVGVEICGKGQNFTRPVIVIKKFGRHAFFRIPLTTKRHEGTWYMPLRYKNINQVVLLSQARFLSYKRLDRKMGELDSEDFKKVKEAFVSLFYE
ncbi:MAG TPA: type II toxin-antitoxin system PemK/MazF family toxin [Candidatus Paceibacterota bacterium]